MTGPQNPPPPLDADKKAAARAAVAKAKDAALAANEAARQATIAAGDPPLPPQPSEWCKAANAWLAKDRASFLVAPGLLVGFVICLVCWGGKSEHTSWAGLGVFLAMVAISLFVQIPNDGTLAAKLASAVTTAGTFAVAIGGGITFWKGIVAELNPLPAAPAPPSPHLTHGAILMAAASVTHLVHGKLLPSKPKP